MKHLPWCVLACLYPILGASQAWSQQFPDKPLRIVTAGIGGGNDFSARLIARGITAGLGQQVIVDNRPSGVFSAEFVAKAPADGYTLLLAGGTMWIGPLLQSVPYDPLRDFLPVTLATSAPQLLVVHPSLPVKSVSELIALAKSRPGELNNASGLTGTSSHLAGELFKSLAGVKIVNVSYKSGGQALNDLLAGHVQLAFETSAPLIPHIKVGRLRALAVTTAQPSALAPGLPTIAASGVPGYEAGALTGIFVPSGTPAATIARLNQEIVRFLKRPDTQEQFIAAGADVIASSPEALAATVKSEIARLGKVIRDMGIKG